MKEKKLIELTSEDLSKKKKLLYTVSGSLAGVLTILLIMIILLVLKSGITAVTIALSIIPVALYQLCF